MAQASAGLRDLLLTLHRWLGLALFVLIVPVAVSGALLVYHDELDALLNPARYAVSGHTTLAPAAYLASAANAAEGAMPVNVRYPEHDGEPVRVQARGAGAEGGRPRLFVVHLDPPTARVLEVVDFRRSLFGFLHVFHENFSIPQYSGRAIVGWVGVALLILSLSGIVIWWPRGNGRLVRALRWKRRPSQMTNTHFSFGFWISIPLAFVSLTGIYLAFPPQARSLMSSVAPMTPQGARNFGPPLRRTALGADQAYEIGRAALADARPVALFLPIGGRGEAEAAPVWRLQGRSADGEMKTVLIDDRAGTARLAPAPLAGDRAAQWIRWLHDGSRGGPVWRFVVLLTGIFPPVLGITGMIMWWRGRRRRESPSRVADGALQAAE